MLKCTYDLEHFNGELNKTFDAVVRFTLSNNSVHEEMYDTDE